MRIRVRTRMELSQWIGLLPVLSVLLAALGAIGRRRNLARASR